MPTCLQNLKLQSISIPQNLSQVTHTMFGKAEGKQFPEVFFTTVALNQAVLFTALQHFTCFHSLRF